MSLSDPYRTAPPKMPEPILDPPKKIRWYTKMNWYDFFHNLWKYTIKIFWSLAVISIIGCVGYCLIKGNTAEDKVDYCYVELTQDVSNSWTLRGNVDWKFDRNFGIFPGTIEAQRYAQKINCPLDLTPADDPVPIPAPPVAASSAAPIQPAPSASVPDLLP